MKSAIPDHVLRTLQCTPEQFRQMKRRQIREVIKAMDAFRRGCAYVPGYQYVDGITDGLLAIKESCKKKNWKKSQEAHL